MSDQQELCAVLQEDELNVLESIYPSSISVQANPAHKPGRLITLSIPITLAEPTTVNLSASSLQPSSSAIVPSIDGLLHLPSLDLRVLLPAAYPMAEAPRPVSLRAALPAVEGTIGNWLSRTTLKQLQDILVEMWQEEKALIGEGTGILWRWCDWVGNGIFLSDRGAMKGALATDIAQNPPSSIDVRPDLVQIVVGKDLRQRWEQLKERRKAEADPSFSFCPLPYCQTPVPPPSKPTAADLVAMSAISKRAIRLSDISNSKASSGSLSPSTTPASSEKTNEDRWERFRTCPACQFSFCLYCSATWHGPHTSCAFPQKSIIVQEYLSYPEGSQGRKNMELRRGKGNLERLVRQWKEDEDNKNYGCGDALSPSDPYSHYRNFRSSCFERLFEEEDIARYEREMEMPGGGGVDLLREDEEAEDEEWEAYRRGGPYPFLR
ncbi:MAG: translation termination inhibitor protein itt1 [Tremellales sp. Tagirdzhanova-0007]|nr:MAG: translation termination inhibitor protein itt1 [Tremellales sp. Tagirdzhanova-0007]